MIQKNLVPEGHSLIVVDGRLRSVRTEGNRLAVASHSSGVALGETANVVATPVLMLAEAVAGLGRAARDSQFGQSTEYGWKRAERRKDVFTTSRSFKNANIQELQAYLQGKNWDAKQILGMSESQIRRAVADLSTPDVYQDEETYMGQVLVSAEQVQKEEASTFAEPSMQTA